MTCDLWPTATIQGIFCWFYWWTPGHQWKHWTGNGYLDQTEFYRFLVACDCRAGPVAAELNARICPSRVNWDCLKSVVPSCILHVSSGNGKILTRSKPPSPQVVEVKLLHWCLPIGDRCRANVMSRSLSMKATWSLQRPLLENISKPVWRRKFVRCPWLLHKNLSWEAGFPLQRQGWDD